MVINVELMNDVITFTHCIHVEVYTVRFKKNQTVISFTFFQLTVNG